MTKIYNYYYTVFVDDVNCFETSVTSDKDEDNIFELTAKEAKYFRFFKGASKQQLLLPGKTWPQAQNAAAAAAADCEDPFARGPRAQFNRVSRRHSPFEIPPRQWRRSGAGAKKGKRFHRGLSLPRSADREERCSRAKIASKRVEFSSTRISEKGITVK